MALTIAFGISWIVLGFLGFLLVGPLQSLTTTAPERTQPAAGNDV